MRYGHGRSTAQSGVFRCTLAAVLGSDRRALLTWPVVVASRVLPACLLVVALGVPAAFWSELPRSRPGPLLFAAVPAVIGVFITVPQALHPVVMGREPFLGPLTSGYLPGLTAAFVQTRFGRLALGVFFMSEAAARTVALTVINAGAARWRYPFVAFLAGAAGSILVAAAASLTLRRFGLTPPTVISVSSHDRPTPIGRPPRSEDSI